MQVLQEVYGIEVDPRFWTVSSAFGGGLGRTQHVCGALTGALMAMGLKDGQTAPDIRKVGAAMRPRVRSLLAAFRERFGDIECRGLVAPYDFDDPVGYAEFRKSDYKQTHCHQYVRFVVETLAREVEGQQGSR